MSNAQVRSHEVPKPGRSVKPNAFVCEAINNMAMIGPFFLMAYYQVNNGRFVGASCTCGWILDTPNGQTHIEPIEFVETCARHNFHHTRYVKVLDHYARGIATYQQARVDLIFHGMEEQRADDILDEMRYQSHG